MSKTLLAFALSLGFINSAIAATDFLNVSYDPTRELYQDYNAAFAKYWKSKGGEDLKLQTISWWLGQTRPIGH